MVDKVRLLNEAAELISNDRNNEYGPPHRNFSDIARGWSVIFDRDVEMHEVALAMDWVKTCRLLKTPAHEDSWVDKAGYTAIGAELITEGIFRYETE